MLFDSEYSTRFMSCLSVRIINASFPVPILDFAQKVRKPILCHQLSEILVFFLMFLGASGVLHW